MGLPETWKNQLRAMPLGYSQIPPAENSIGHFAAVGIVTLSALLLPVVHCRCREAVLGADVLLPSSLSR